MAFTGGCAVVGIKITARRGRETVSITTEVATRPFSKDNEMFETICEEVQSQQSNEGTLSIGKGYSGHEVQVVKPRLEIPPNPQIW